MLALVAVLAVLALLVVSTTAGWALRARRFDARHAAQTWTPGHYRRPLTRGAHMPEPEYTGPRIRDIVTTTAAAAGTARRVADLWNDPPAGAFLRAQVEDVFPELAEALHELLAEQERDAAVAGTSQVRGRVLELAARSGLWDRDDVVAPPAEGAVLGAVVEWPGPVREWLPLAQLVVVGPRCSRCGVAAPDDLACGDPCCGGCDHPPGPGHADYPR